MPLDAAQFRHTMSQLATGVSVVTVRTPAGLAIGMTASSVTSLSLEPPLLLVCVAKEAAIHGLLLGAVRFGINVLAAEQEALAGALAQIECRRRGHFTAGDHSVVTGTLEWSDVGDGRPLCYFRGGFAELGK